MTMNSSPTYFSSPTTIVNVLGVLGVSSTGLYIYGPTEGNFPANQAYGDPVANGILDYCGGHTAQNGDYHFHTIYNKTECFPNPLVNDVVGFAKDGFPILANPGYYYKSGYTLVIDA